MHRFPVVDARKLFKKNADIQVLMCISVDNISLHIGYVSQFYTVITNFNPSTVVLSDRK